MQETSFLVNYHYRNDICEAEVKLCCNQEDVWYYDVLMDGAYQFTLTPLTGPQKEVVWKVSLKNSDRVVDDALVQAIGMEIEKYLLSSGLD